MDYACLGQRRVVRVNTHQHDQYHYQEGAARTTWNDVEQRVQTKTMGLCKRTLRVNAHWHGQDHYQEGAVRTTWNDVEQRALVGPRHDRRKTTAVRSGCKNQALDQLVAARLLSAVTGQRALPSASLRPRVVGLGCVCDLLTSILS